MHKPPITKQSGLTIIELTIVVSIILILAGVAIPSLARGRRAAQVSALGDEFRTYYEAFMMYAQEHPGAYGSLPVSSPEFGDIPAGTPGNPGMDAYFSKTMTWTWKTDSSDRQITSPKFRGRWAWRCAPDTIPGGYTGAIMFWSTDTSSEVASQIDARLDDGNINTGAIRFEEVPGGMWIYFLVQ